MVYKRKQMKINKRFGGDLGIEVTNNKMNI